MKRILVALALLFAVPAWAANSISIDSIATYATYHNIGVRIYFSGDDDSNATVQLGIRHADRRAGEDTLTLFRSTKNGGGTSASNGVNGAAGSVRKYYATSAMMCGADSLFHFFLTVTDPGGCTNCPTDFANPRTPTFMARTAVNNTTARLASLPKGKQIWMSPLGDDANNGLDSAHPMATFAAAVAAMTTPGDQLRLEAGTYYATDTDSLGVSADSKNGTTSKYYSVVGDPGGVTISGADRGSLDPAFWTCQDIGGGVMAYRRGLLTAAWPREMTLGDTTRLYPYTSFYRFLTDPLGVVHDFGAFWVDEATNKVAYVRPPARLVPNPVVGHSLAQDGPTIGRVGLPLRNAAIRINSAFWRVDSLTFRDFGTGNNNDLNWAVVNVSNQGNVVENCTFLDLGNPSVGIRGYFDGTVLRTHSNTIQNNLFVTHTLGSTWDKAGLYVGFDKMAGLGCVTPGAGDTTCLANNIVYPVIIIEEGRGHVIRWNRVVGGPDAFVRWDNLNPDTCQNALTDCDVYQNFTLNMGDDVIEPDPASGLNTRIYKNVLLGGHTPMNWYASRGPMYFVFNTCVNQFGMLPEGSSTLAAGMQNGHTIIANNTFTTRRAEALEMWVTPQNTDHNAYVNHVVVNNIINGNTATVRESGCLLLNEFNWNTGYVNTGSQWSGTQYGTIGHTQSSLQAWRDSTYGYGANDTRTNSLQYADSLNWDWSPQNTWSDVLGPTKARSFPGVNTNTRLHVSPAWWVNRSGSSDSTYVGAWPVNGRNLEAAGAPPPCNCEEK